MTEGFNHVEVIIPPFPEWKRDCMKRVEEGTKWLDENYPSWYQLIDTSELEMSDGNMCICGQVFRDMGNTDGFLYFRDTYGNNALATEYGFLSKGYEWTDSDGYWHGTTGDEEYSFLAEEWLLQVAKREANADTAGRAIR